MVSITVALSVYNVADYIRSSIESILSQTYDDFELLCIDDASTDATWDILKEYAGRDNRIRLIRHEINQGLSVSRNRAIKEAIGEYLVMLDGDDLFAPDMLRKAYDKAKEEDAEMVLWDYVTFTHEAEIERKCARPSTMNGIDVNNKIQLLKRPAFTPSRLLKTSTVRSLNIHYPEGLTKQDIPVHWKLVTSLSSVAIIPEYFLFYRQQPNSTSNKKGRSVFSLAYVMDIVRRQLMEDDLYEAYREEFLRSRLSLLHGMYDGILPGLKSEALTKVKERLGGDEKAYISNPQNELSSRVRDFYGMLNGDRMSLIRYKGFNAIRSIYRLFKKPM